MIPRPRVPRVGRSSLILILTVAALAFPLGVLASHQFSDVPDSHDFHNDIDAIADAGVTTGCTASTYCPADFVTRGQMAAFMNRLGSLDGNTTPSVNADTARSTDGWSLGCPSGTVWSQNLCFETTSRTADTVYDAADTCASAGPIIGGHRYHLPTIHQLRAARGVSGITLDALGEHTDSLYQDEGTFYSFLAFDNGNIDDAIGNTVREFRCVTTPISLDPFFIVLPLDEQERYPELPQYGDTTVDSNGAPVSE